MFGNNFLGFCLFLFLFLLSIQSILTLSCYECNICTNITTCTCATEVNYDINNAYCIILRENIANQVHYEIKHVPRNSTSYYIYDPYYISVRERISYNSTTERWLSISDEITYACQTDRCNRDSLLKQLPPNGLSLMLPIDWLNENLVRKSGENMTLCRECPDEIICGDPAYVSNTSKCNAKECEGLCAMSETFKYAETPEFCYQSFCASSSSVSSNERLPEIDIEAVYYLNTKLFEIVEIDVICHGNDCSRLQIFNDIKEKLQKDFNGTQPFLPVNYVNSIYSTSIIIFLIMILLQILIFY